jgi:hypothetical protein
MDVESLRRRKISIALTAGSEAIEEAQLQCRSLYVYGVAYFWGRWMCGSNAALAPSGSSRIAEKEILHIDFRLVNLNSYNY